jgi:bifunctional non-homologous end joining protein LigD
MQLAGDDMGVGSLPRWVKPQLCALVDEPPQGPEWLHEIKYDGYRMHARLDHGKVQLLTRTGLDWTHKYTPIASALSSLPVKEAYLDGELCGVRPDGKTSFNLIQAASDTGKADALVFFLFDLLYLDGDAISSAPLLERKERLRGLLSNAGSSLQYSDHQIGRGPDFYAGACELSLEGIISKRADAPYAAGNRGLWVKVKCLNREEFVVVGWKDPEGSRPWLGALLLAYYTPDGRLVYAAVLGLASTTQSWSDYGVACNRSPHPKCRSTCPRLGPVASVHRSFSAACIGFDQSLWPR